VLLGEVGTTGEYTAIGDAVNLASRLEHAAPMGGVLISHDTYHHVRGIFSVREPNPIHVAGRAEPMRVYLVRGVAPRTFRTPTRGMEGACPELVEGVETRMIGREAELEHLQDALHTVLAEGRMRMVTVVGDAGIGKSRLLHEFGHWVEQLPDEVTILKGRATQRISSQPYSLVRDLLASSLGIKSSDSAETAREKLERGVSGLMGKETRMQAHFIGHLIGLDFSESPHLRNLLDDARQIRDRAFHYVTQLFAAATRRPVLLLLDDLHWADDGSLDLIEHLARECRSMGLLIVALTRPDLFERRPAWGDPSTGSGQGHHTRLELRPLSERDSRLMVAEILREVERTPADLRDLVVARAAGNPFYTEELIKMLIEDRVIVRDEEGWSVEPGHLVEVRVPPTLVGVLQARLDGLPPPEREVLQRAAVVGRMFWEGAVEQLDGEADVGEALAALQEKQLIFEQSPSTFAQQREFVFKHAILHDVAYEGVLMRQRRAYHAQVAAWLTAQSGERGAEYAGLIGGHYERAEKRSQAAKWYTRAGRQAQDTYAPQEAIGYYRKALDFSSDESLGISQRIDLFRRLGLMLLWQTQFERATEAYAAMREAAEAAGDLTAQARAWEGLSLVQQRQGCYRAALESAERAAEASATEVSARQAGESAREVLARALSNKGWILSNLGESEAALSLGEQALALGTELGARSVMTDSLNLLGRVHRALGQYERAARYFEQTLELARESDDRVQMGRILTDLGIIAAKSRRDYPKAEALFREALSIVQEIGHRFGEIVILHNLGGVRVDMGEYQEAEADLLQVIDVAERIGWGDLSATYDFLARAYLGQGKVSEALATAKRALELGRESESQEDIGKAWRALGMTLADPLAPESIAIDGERLGVRACFARGLRVFAETGMEDERARTLEAWARYEREHGDGERGAEMEREAREIFARLGIGT
jgi:tetratricopeptide (TPR) repeat protein